MVLDAVRIKGRWQDDHFLRTGHLATLKGDYMEIKNVQIPFSLFRQLVSYHLMEDQSCSEEICKGLMEKVDRMANQAIIYTVETASTDGRTGKIPAGISGLDEVYQTVSDGNSSC